METPMQTDTQEQAKRVVEAPVESAPMATRSTAVRDARPAAQVTEPPAQQWAYRHSDTFGRLVMALAQAQGEFQEIEKTLTATVQSRREGARSYTYDYADLATILTAVRPALSKYGLAIMQFPTVRRGAVLVTTFLAHGESGEWFAGDLVVALDSADPQAVGSATTYARRYGLTALLGVAAGAQDDDGAAASGQAVKPAPEAPVGYDAWLDDMNSVADEGTARLQATWTTSRPEYRNHLIKTAPQTWAAIKAKAAKVASVKPS